MIRGSHYRKLAAQARRLADAMHQPDVIEVLRIAAREYDALAADSELDDQEMSVRKQG